MSESMISVIINYFMYSAITASVVIIVLFVLDMLYKGKQKEKNKAYAQFIEGVRNNKLDAVKQFFRENETPLNECHEDLRVKLGGKAKSQALTPLMYAAHEGYSHIVKLLCDCGATVDVKVDKSEALHLAAMNRQAKCLEILISAKANINAKDANGQTPIMLGCSDDEILKTLINKGADTSITDTKGESVMYKLIKDDTLGVKILLDSGYDINSQINEDKDSVLLAAIKLGYDATAGRLAKMGANVDQKDKSGATSLLLAVEKSKTDLVAALLQEKTDVNQFNSTLLHIAVKHKNANLIQLLVDSGIKMNEKNKDDQHPLELAVETNNLSLIELLLKNGAEIDKAGKDGNTVLSTAIKANNQKLAELAIKYKANVNQFGSTLIHIAINNNDLELAKLLIDNKIEINKADKAGSYPLELAINTNNLDLVELLLKNKADVDQRKKEKETALTSAIIQGNYKLSELLLKYGADANQKTADELPIINAAVFQNSSELVKLLISHDADVNIKKKDGLYPLQYAIEEENTVFIDMLIKAGAKKHEDYLEIAINKNNASLVKLLVDYNFNVSEQDCFITLKQNFLEIFDLLTKAKRRTFQGIVHPLEIETFRDKLSLTLEKVQVNPLGTELFYRIEKIGQLTAILEQTAAISSVLGVKRVNIHELDHGIMVQVLNDSKEAELISNLMIRNEHVKLFSALEKDSTEYLFFHPVRGSSIKDWLQEKEYIENVLGQPVEIEEYDKSHPLYDRNFSTEKLIVIRESALSAMPDVLEIGGSYLKEDTQDNRTTYFFENVTDSELWSQTIDEIKKYINKDIEIKSYDKARYIIQIQDSVAEALPYMLGIEDDDKKFSKLIYSEKDGENNYYYYTFLAGADLRFWKEKIKKKNLRVLFNEPEKVYEVEMFDSTNKEYKQVNGEDGSFIRLKELAKIPTGSELMDVSPSDFLVDGKVFWGYGSGKEQYYTTLSDTMHMMVIGGTGSGKSNFMNGVILSLLHNIESVGKLYLIDLKSGVEFNKYMDLDADKVEVFSKGTKPSKLLAALLEVEAEMYLRQEYMASNRIAKITTDPIFLIIDEYAQIETMVANDMKERQAKLSILDTLLKIGSLSRASNIKLFAQTQDPLKVESELKKHMMSRSLLKTGNYQDNVYTLQQPDKLDELGINHTEFGKGRYVFEDYNEGDTKTTELQFPYIEPEKEYHMLYKDKAQIINHELDDKLSPYIEEIRKDYEHLVDTQRLEIDEKTAEEEVVQEKETVPVDKNVKKESLEPPVKQESNAHTAEATTQTESVDSDEEEIDETAQEMEKILADMEKIMQESNPDTVDTTI